LAADLGFAWAYGCRGAAYQALGRLTESLADLDRAVELKPRYVWALGTRAETLRRMGRFPEALADTDRAIEEAPDYVYGLRCRVSILLAMGDSHRAAAGLRQVIELSGGQEWALHRLARAADLRTDEAFTPLLELVFAANPHRIFRAMWLFTLGDEPAAIESLRSALADGIPADVAAEKFRRFHEATGLDIGPMLAVLE
jgi:tetratricopeptide (TPR) repeat protein